MLGQPESPRWLVQKDRTSEAEQSARKLWGTEGAAQLGDTKSGGKLSSFCLQPFSLPHNSTAYIQPSHSVVLWLDPIAVDGTLEPQSTRCECVQAYLPAVSSAALQLHATQYRSLLLQHIRCCVELTC